MELQKNVHYSPDLEAAVLGASMLEKTAFGRTYGILKQEMLRSESNQLVYEAIHELYSAGLPVDILTVVDRMMRDKRMISLFGADLEYYITKLTYAVVSSAHIEYHCWILKRMWMEREVIKLTSGAVKLQGDVMQQIIQLQTAIRDINAGEMEKEWYDMSELAMDLLKHQEHVKANPTAFIKTGIAQVDDKNGGFYPGNLIVIGARPGAGKSAFMGQLALNMARDGKKVGILSLEMSNNEIAARLSAVDSDIDFQKVYRGLFQDENEKDRFYDRLSRVTSELPIFISDTTRLNTIDIRAKADKLKARKGLDFLFIDYLQLISADQGKNKTRENIISEISRSCKIMAKELQIPIAILCQLNRDSTKRAGDSRYPQLSDLRESGAIEQDADVVMFIHRDWVVGITQDAQGGSTENQADLIVRKWRNAEPNLHVRLEFDGPKMAFRFNRTQPWKAVKMNFPDREVDFTKDQPF
jgi:replicative DNA helicase